VYAGIEGQTGEGSISHHAARCRVGARPRR
jgi:hypothetical protein